MIWKQNLQLCRDWHIRLNSLKLLSKTLLNTSTILTIKELLYYRGIFSSCNLFSRYNKLYIMMYTYFYNLYVFEVFLFAFDAY